MFRRTSPQNKSKHSTFFFIPPTLANVLKEVVCVSNYIKANQLRSRILSHTEVRWLSKRKNLEFLCFYESWNHLVHRYRGSWFFVSKGWCLVGMMSFVSERFFDKLKEVNLSLQEAEENFITIRYKLKAFKEILILWNSKSTNQTLNLFRQSIKSIEISN